METNKLNPAELERLAILSEEAAEVQQIAMKIIRHGYESCNPFDEEKTTNRELLEKELGDLSFIVKLMRQCLDVDSDKIREATTKKRLNIQKYLHHNTL